MIIYVIEILSLFYFPYSKKVLTTNLTHNINYTLININIYKLICTYIYEQRSTYIFTSYHECLYSNSFNLTTNTRIHYYELNYR